MTFSVPALLKGPCVKLVVVPAPDLVKVPPAWFVKVIVTPEPKLKKPELFWALNIPPDWLLMALVPRRFPISPEIQVTVPALLIVWPPNSWPLPTLMVNVAPEAITSVPPPFIAPPVQLPAPLTVSVPLPPRFPLLRFRFTVLAAALKFPAPPVMLLLPVTA